MTPEIAEKKKYLLHWMYDFIIDEEEPAYLKKDVDECDHLLIDFIDCVETSEHKADFTWVASQVEALVKNLNDLNARLENQLIETDQREDLCALVALVMQHAGHSYEGDITEMWRKW